MLDWRKRCSLARPTYLLSALMALSACGTGEGGTDETMIDNSVDAVQGNNKATDLPILKTLPIDGAVPIRPDTAIQIYLDKNARTFARFRNQFEKGAFTITINQKPLIGSYDANSGIITGRHDLLDRYTRYDVKLLVKAMMNSPNTNSGNASYSFGFKTGSALHEATHLDATVKKSAVRVTEKAEVGVKVTDDYGLAAANATVTAENEGGTTTLAIKPESFVLNASSNGVGSFEITDTKPETAKIKVTSQDNVYHDEVDTEDQELSIQFLPGLAAKIELQGIAQYEDGTVKKLRGTVSDSNGNFVEDGTVITASATAGNLDPPNKTTTKDGRFEFTYTPPIPPAASTFTFSAQGMNGTVTASATISLCLPPCADGECSPDSQCEATEEEQRELMRTFEHDLARGNYPISSAESVLKDLWTNQPMVGSNFHSSGTIPFVENSFNYCFDLLHQILAEGDFCDDFENVYINSPTRGTVRFALPASMVATTLFVECRAISYDDMFLGIPVQDVVAFLLQGDASVGKSQIRLETLNAARAYYGLKPVSSVDFALNGLFGNSTNFAAYMTALVLKHRAVLVDAAIDGDFSDGSLYLGPGSRSLEDILEETSWHCAFNKDTQACTTMKDTFANWNGGGVAAQSYGTVAKAFFEVISKISWNYGGW